MAPRGTVTNLATQSETFSTWTPIGLTSPAYAGPFPARVSAGVTLTDDATGSHGLSLTVTPAYARREILSVYSRAGSGGVDSLCLYADPGQYFYLPCGAAQAPAVGNGGSYYGVDDVGGGWFRSWASYTSTSFASRRVYMAKANTLSFTGNGAGLLPLTGAMLEVAQPGQTTPSPYVASGATPGVGPRDTRQNHYRYSEDLTKSEHVKNTGVTAVSGSLDVSAPSDLPGASVQKLAYDGSGVSGDYRLYSNVASIEPVYRNGNPYAFAFWARTLSGTLSLRAQVCTNVQAFTVTSSWQRFLFLATGNGSSGIQPTIFSAVGNNAAFTLYTTGLQIAQTNQMPDYVKTNGAPFNPNGAPRSLAL